MQCVDKGHHLVCLANLKPPEGTDELDSYMYQTVGHDALDMYSQAWGELPFYRETICGKPLLLDKEYEPTDADEVEDLYRLLSTVKSAHPNLEGVSAGAILSEYQKVRVENVCERLDLEPLCYLWHRDQRELLDEMIDRGLQAILIKVACLGLEPHRHLGLRLDQIRDHLLAMSDKWGLNVCGEGGEFETFVLDCPLFTRRLKIDHAEVVIHSEDAFAPVGYLKLDKLHLEDK